VQQNEQFCCGISLLYSVTYHGECERKHRARQSTAIAFPHGEFIRRNRIAHLVAKEGSVYFEPQSQWQICDERGRRKYLNEHERQRFLDAADREDTAVRVLCYVLAYTGCRISEALALTSGQCERAGAITFRTLKRRRLCYRTVPVPSAVASMLAELPVGKEGRYWAIHRSTAWRHIKRILAEIEVQGPMACCKGLRHGFGINAAAQSVPPNLIQRWMGHAFASTTSIYLDAVGLEERQFAERMWR